MTDHDADQLAERVTLLTEALTAAQFVLATHLAHLVHEGCDNLYGHIVNGRGWCDEHLPAT